ncbi:MAG TPA: CheR family methyltransferase [Flavitalea sp.]|nr:CheR family methyltransferase [Flavitalea sp.]
MSDQSVSNSSENGSPHHDKKNFLVVGIGASAGGVNALKEFFEYVPVDSGMAYVVILHLSPNYDSKLAEVLQIVSKIPVHKVNDITRIQPDNVYVIPPDKSLKMVDGHVTVNSIITVEERRAPVDIFFRTLAETHGDRAVAVILSGTGANGSMGLKRVKENGGAAFVQNPRQAEFNEMPRNAIATDLIDAVLPTADIPGKLMAYKQNLNSVKIIPEIINTEEEQEKALRAIFTQLRSKTGHDFSNYKRATLLRRIERRINVHNLPDLLSYAAFIMKVPEESQALLKDLLISVTNFFRDKEAFDYIESQLVPMLLAGTAYDEKIRIWVAGCATGEEAYSLAMIFKDQLGNSHDKPEVQIFATDIDEDALGIAREGIYSINDAADVSPERLRKFFSKVGNDYKIRREIREMVLFANHNIIKDPPFSKLQMVTCRNMMIYLNQTAHKRAIETIHFGLNPGGYLFVGSSESVNHNGELFVHLSKEHYIYQSRPVTTRTVPVPDLMPAFRFNTPPVEEAVIQERKALERITYNDLHQQLLERYAPPSVVINNDFDLVHLSDKAGRYLQYSGGEPSNNLLKLIRPELRLELRSGLYQALQRKVNLELKDLNCSVDGTNVLLHIYIRPVFGINATSSGYILVIFDEYANGHEDTKIEKLESPYPVAHQLEEELLRSKAQLRGSIEQYEVQAEELRASNEELQAMNEELRSSAEELETSKEELQSINEELTTVNQELKIKIEELSQSNNNFQNLINSTDIGTIFLDRSMRVNLFAPAVRKIYNLISNDIGRPLSDISNHLLDTDILSDAEKVIERLQSIEREVRSTDHRVYMMRIFPYRTADDRINGVVLTFIDITQRKKAELELLQSESNLRMVMDSVFDYAIITFTTEMVINGWNTGAQNVFGYTSQEIIGKSMHTLFTPEDNNQHALEGEIVRVLETGRSEDERWHLRKDGSRFYASGIVNRLKEGQNGFVKIARDMTAHKLIEQQKDEFIGIASHELKTPVTSIKAYTEILHEIMSENQDGQSLELMTKLNSQVDRLTTLINDLLDTTQISEGHLVLKMEEFDINQLIEECKDDFAQIISNNKIIANLQEVPKIYADRERILQVITNLISNGIKYSPEGGNIIISTAARNNNLQISVEDFGIGIPDESTKHVFERFYRTNNPLISTFPGLGLGLYITGEIVKRHEGKVTVESKEGQGSKFIVTLPLRTNQKD